MTNVKQTVTALESALAELTERAHRSAEQLDRVTHRAEQLEQRLARGTLQPEVAVPTPTVPTLAAELERIFRAQPVSTADAAMILGVPVSHAARVVREFRRAKQVVNAGTHERPLWSWVLGDNGSTTDLVAKVEQLLRMRPMTLAELCSITGARRNRLSGSVVLLRRHGVQVDNSGNGHRAVYSIPSTRKNTR